MEDERMSVKISIRPNGPYLVEGDVELIDPTGNKVDTTGRAKMALCRCGASVTKPFCDGTHSKIGFQAAEAAVAQEKK
jgi:CDGSH-type Zn-finger protein